MSHDIPTAEDVKGILSDVGGYSPRRLIAAAGTAAHRLPDEYDPVRAVEALPELVEKLEKIQREAYAKGSPSDIIPAIQDYVDDALAKARGDDA